MLKVENLRKTYKIGNNSYLVLKDLSFQVKKGEFVAVMGPSGSGKTTLLNCISCFIPHDQGKILLNGKDLSGLGQEELAGILRQAADTAHGLGMELDFTSPGWLPEETLRSMGLALIPSCGACLSNMAVAPDGTVLPCQSWLEGPGLGNLCADDWAAIWDGPQCRRIRADSAKMEHICQLQQEGGC